MSTRVALIALVALAVSASTMAADVKVDVRFGLQEVAIIRDYYDALGRKDRQTGRRLPPGIAKNLERGKPLPPGIAKESLPADLLRRLPDVPDGHERIILDGRILLVETATQVVRDILTDIVY